MVVKFWEENWGVEGCELRARNAPISEAFLFCLIKSGSGEPERLQRVKGNSEGLEGGDR